MIIFNNIYFFLIIKTPRYLLLKIINNYIIRLDNNIPSPRTFFNTNINIDRYLLGNSLGTYFVGRVSRYPTENK